ncbi:hypothetical protein D3C81_2339170 [compost metagenome]
MAQGLCNGGQGGVNHFALRGLAVFDDESDLHGRVLKTKRCRADPDDYGLTDCILL